MYIKMNDYEIYGRPDEIFELIKLKGGEYVRDFVRCKDCKYNHIKSWNQGKRDNPSCYFTDFIRSNEFYCGFGERAEA